MMTPSFELFDHTADMGIWVRAGTPAELLEPAARGLYAAIGELVPGEAAGSSKFDLTGGDRAVLLRDFLTELLILFERDHLMVTQVEQVTFDDGQLRATVRLHQFDADRSDFAREVKAVTYHELEVCEVDGGYEARVIVDI